MFLDNAGGLLVGIKMKFGGDVNLRTCAFHYIYSAYQHTGYAIGAEKEQVIFLRHVFALKEASTAPQYESLYKLFRDWITELDKMDKNGKTIQSLRSKKLLGYLEFWNNSRTNWSDAFVNLNLTEVNLQEGLNSKFSKKTNSKNLVLSQAVTWEIAECVKYQERLKAMSRGGFIGQGPSKEILDEREAIRQMERVKNINFTEADLQDIFIKLGLPVPVPSQPIDCEETEFDPIINAEKTRNESLLQYVSDPSSSHTYKTRKSPKKMTVLEKGHKKPGRPVGSNSKPRNSRFQTLDSDNPQPSTSKHVNQKFASPLQKQNIKRISSDSSNHVNKRIPDRDSDTSLPTSPLKKRNRNRIISDSSEEDNFSSEEVDSTMPKKQSSLFTPMIIDSDNELPDLPTSRPKKQPSLFTPMIIDSDDELPDLPTSRPNKTKNVIFAMNHATFNLGSPEDETAASVIVSENEDEESHIDISSDEDTQNTQPTYRTRHVKSQHYKKMTERASKEQGNYTVQKMSNTSYRLTKITGAHHPINKLTEDGTYLVTFEQNEVTCTCPHYRNILAGKVATARNLREICKHIALIVLKSDPRWHEFYNGQRIYNNAEFDDLYGLLASVDISRIIPTQDGKLPVKKKKLKKSVVQESYPDPVELPVLLGHEKGPFKNQYISLQAAPEPIWFAEIYNRTSKGGNYPTCQSENCNAKFRIGDLTIRTDVFESYPRYDQGKKVNLYFIKAVKYRFCVNPICINQLSQKKKKRVKF